MVFGVIQRPKGFRRDDGQPVPADQPIPRHRSLIVHPDFTPLLEVSQRPAKSAVLWTPSDKVGRIIRAVCKKHGVTVEEVKSRTRRRKVCVARQEAMFMLRVQLRFGYVRVARAIGVRDHTTVVHGVRAHAKRHGLDVPKFMGR